MLSVIESLMSRGRLAMVELGIVSEEISRFQVQVPEPLRRRYKTYLKHARLLLNAFVKDDELASQSADLLSHIDSEIRSEQVKSEDAFSRISELLTSPHCSHIPASDQLRLAASERALAKRAPFHDGKNSFADALVFEAYLAVLEEPFFQNLDVVLVTDNTSDFSDPKNHKLLHPDLREDTESLAHAKYSINIAETLNDIEETEVTLRTMEAMNRYVPFVPFHTDPPPPPTSHCPDGHQHEFAENLGGCLRSQFGGLTWHVRCRRCGFVYDTGEHCD